MVVIGGHYVLGDIVGKGAFGSVHKAHDRSKNRMVAVKESPIVTSNEVMLEIEVLKKLSSPHVVSYYDFIQTPENLYIVLEWCDSSVRHVISKYGLFGESTAAHCIAQVLDGLIYLHEQAVIHRDIKSSNILMNHEGKVKLADFGVSALVDGTRRAESVVGTPYWMAPEVIEQAGAVAQSDIWALGCTVIELIKGNPPYAHMAPMAALFRIVTDPCPPIPTDVSPDCSDFLSLCFKKDPRNRPCAKELRQHCWLKDFPPTQEKVPLAITPGKPSGGKEEGDWSDDEMDFSELELSVPRKIGHITLSTAQKLTSTMSHSVHKSALANFVEDDLGDDLDDLELEIDNLSNSEEEDDDGDDLNATLADTLAKQSRHNESIDLDLISSDSDDDVASPLAGMNSVKLGNSLLKRKVITLVQSFVSHNQSRDEKSSSQF
ncbi:hypothetical protein GEMRC1_013483 [Eukaryota sp. GEM-RC1]